ncbi:MAG: DUF1292 domain-containing protein [Clostridia bacterium]|nr:DUF1292 domain-containing protein [Clostridia bacterium]MBO5409513.1 DUF1292 domain-containing protein [Clostridia bacterium]
MDKNKNMDPMMEENIITLPDDTEDEPIEQIVTLYDEDGNPEDYELIDLFEFKDGIYGAFTPVLTGEEPDQVDVVMLKVTEDGNAFIEIEDPSEEEAVFQELLRREDSLLD